jgi:hypothetical protein
MQQRIITFRLFILKQLGCILIIIYEQFLLEKGHKIIINVTKTQKIKKHENTIT